MTPPSLAAEAASYRTRVFIQMELLPHADQLRTGLRLLDDRWEPGVPALQSLLGRLLDRGVDDGLEDGRLLLPTALLTEKLAWLEIGSELGYFTAGALPGSRAEDVTEAVLGSMSDLLVRDFDGARYCVPGDLDLLATADTDNFAGQLLHAFESLAEENLEFLYLTHFADDAEWEYRVTPVRELAKDLAAHPLLGADPESVEEGQWAMSGAERSGEPGTPSWWRATEESGDGTLHPPDFLWPSAEARLQWRLDELGELRAGILASFERLTIEPQTGALVDLRRAGAQLHVREGPYID
jgi:hypothetical protein